MNTYNKVILTIQVLFTAFFAAGTVHCVIQRDFGQAFSFYVAGLLLSLSGLLEGGIRREKEKV